MTKKSMALSEQADRVLDGVNFMDPRDQVALARLGAAAVVLWNRLPAETRKRLLYFSATLDGLPTLANGGVRIARLIGANALKSDQDSN
jgi:hypothetical protein